MLESAMAWIVERSGEWLAFLAGSALKAGVVLAVAAVVVLLLRRASAATRHQVWRVAVVCAVVIPLLALLLPRIPVPVPGLDHLGVAGSDERHAARSWALPGFAVAPDVYVKLGEPEAISVRPTPAPRHGHPARGAVAPGRARAVPVQPAVPPPPPPMPVPPGSAVEPGVSVLHAMPRVPHAAAAFDLSELTPGVSGLGGVPGSGLTFPWALVVLGVWGFGTWLVLALLVAGVLRVQWLTWRLSPFGGRCAALARAIADELGVGRVQVLQGPATAMPMTWGVIHPTILLPSSAAEWPIERLDAVLRHELAHVRRRDTLTQLIADVACAIYWFNPLAWVAAHRLRVEREHACDDEVIAAGSRASDYAEQLLQLTRSLRAARSTALTAIAMARPGQLHGRLTAVLDEERSRTRVSRAAAVRGWLLAAALVLPLAMIGFVPAAPLAADIPVGGVAVYAAPRAGIVILPSDFKESISRSVEEIAEAMVSLEAVELPIPRGPDSRWWTPADLAPVPLVASAPWRKAQDCTAAREGRGSFSIHHDDDVREVTWKNGPCRGAVRLEGEVEFSEDFTAITGLSRGGEIRFEEDDGRTERRLQIRRDGDELVYDFEVDGDDHPFDAAGRAWLDGMLLQLFRTGFMAEERVAWMLDARGLDAVIQEIGQLRSSYARRIYYEAALAHPDLSAAQAAALIRQAGAEIGSDYELAELLIATVDDRPFDEEIRDAFLEAAQSLESDYEHRRVLDLALTSGDLSPANVAVMLESAESIGSDYERAELLVALAERYIDSPELRTSYLRAAAGIGSDYEKRRVLDAVLSHGGLSADDVALVLDVAESIGSDYERAELLVGVADDDVSDPALQLAYIAAASGIGSDYELRRALSALVANQQLTSEVVAELLNAVEQIGSDYEKAELLLEIAQEQPIEGDVREAFLRALDTIGSTHEHGRVASALLRSTR